MLFSTALSNFIAELFSGVLDFYKPIIDKCAIV